MKISENGIDFLIAKEGFKTKAYKDTKGLWTIGVGHLIGKSEQDMITKHLTKEEVKELFAKDIERFEKTVNHVIHNDITQYQFDSLVSFCFNIGQTGFTNSTVAKKINTGLFAEVGAAMLLWNKPKEIIGRRKSEVKLFETGDYT